MELPGIVLQKLILKSVRRLNGIRMQLARLGRFSRRRLKSMQAEFFQLSVQALAAVLRDSVPSLDWLTKVRGIVLCWRGDSTTRQ